MIYANYERSGIMSQYLFKEVAFFYDDEQNPGQIGNLWCDGQLDEVGCYIFGQAASEWLPAPVVVCKQNKPIVAMFPSMGDFPDDEFHYKVKGKYVNDTGAPANTLPYMVVHGGKKRCIIAQFYIE